MALMRLDSSHSHSPGSGSPSGRGGRETFAAFPSGTGQSWQPLVDKALILKVGPELFLYAVIGHAYVGQDLGRRAHTNEHGANGWVPQGNCIAAAPIGTP
jgi:hypothetical protein